MQGFLLLGDLGVHSYLDTLNPENVEKLYGDALGALMVMHTHKDTRADRFPPYDRSLLINEMQLFRDWYLEKHLGLALHPEQWQMLDEVLNQIRMYLNRGEGS